MKRQSIAAFTLIELLVVVAIIALLIAILLPSLAAVKLKAQTTRCLANTKGLSNATATYAAANDNFIIPAATAYVGTDMGYFAIVVDRDVNKPSVAAPTPLNFRSTFVCPTTPDSDQSAAANSQTQDGYWQNTSTSFDVNLGTASNPTGANALILQSSYGLNGNNNHNLNTLPCQTLASNGSGARRMSTILRPSLTVFMYDGITINPDYSTAYRIMGRHGKQSGTDRALIGQTNIAFFDGHSETAPRSQLPHDAAEFTGASTAFTHRTFIWRLDQ